MNRGRFLLYLFLMSSNKTTNSQKVHQQISCVVENNKPKQTISHGVSSSTITSVKMDDQLIFVTFLKNFPNQLSQKNIKSIIWNIFFFIFKLILFFAIIGFLFIFTLKSFISSRKGFLSFNFLLSETKELLLGNLISKNLKEKKDKQLKDYLNTSDYSNIKEFKSSMNEFLTKDFKEFLYTEDEELKTKRGAILQESCDSLKSLEKIQDIFRSENIKKNVEASGMEILNELLKLVENSVSSVKDLSVFNDSFLDKAIHLINYSIPIHQSLLKKILTDKKILSTIRIALLNLIKRQQENHFRLYKLEQKNDQTSLNTTNTFDDTLIFALFDEQFYLDIISTNLDYFKQIFLNKFPLFFGHFINLLLPKNENLIFMCKEVLFRYLSCFIEVYKARNFKQNQSDECNNNKVLSLIEERNSGIYSYAISLLTRQVLMDRAQLNSVLNETSDLRFLELKLKKISESDISAETADPADDQKDHKEILKHFKAGYDFYFKLVEEIPVNIPLQKIFDIQYTSASRFDISEKNTSLFTAETICEIMENLGESEFKNIQELTTQFVKITRFFENNELSIIYYALGKRYIHFFRHFFEVILNNPKEDQYDKLIYFYIRHIIRCKSFIELTEEECREHPRYKILAKYIKENIITPNNDKITTISEILIHFINKRKIEKNINIVDIFNQNKDLVEFLLRLGLETLALRDMSDFDKDTLTEVLNNPEDTHNEKKTLKEIPSFTKKIYEILAVFLKTQNKKSADALNKLLVNHLIKIYNNLIKCEDEELETIINNFLYQVSTFIINESRFYYNKPENPEKDYYIIDSEQENSKEDYSIEDEEFKFAESEFTTVNLLNKYKIQILKIIQHCAANNNDLDSESEEIESTSIEKIITSMLRLEDDRKDDHHFCFKLIEYAIKIVFNSILLSTKVVVKKIRNQLNSTENVSINNQHTTDFVCNEVFLNIQKILNGGDREDFQTIAIKTLEELCEKFFHLQNPDINLENQEIAEGELKIAINKLFIYITSYKINCYNSLESIVVTFLENLIESNILYEVLSALFKLYKYDPESHFKIDLRTLLNNFINKDLLTKILSFFKNKTFAEISEIKFTEIFNFIVQGLIAMPDKKEICHLSSYVKVSSNPELSSMTAELEFWSPRLLSSHVPYIFLQEHKYDESLLRYFRLSKQNNISELEDGSDKKMSDKESTNATKGDNQQISEDVIIEKTQLTSGIKVLFSNLKCCGWSIPCGTIVSFILSGELTFKLVNALLVERGTQLSPNYKKIIKSHLKQSIVPAITHPITIVVISAIIPVAPIVGGLIYLGKEFINTKKSTPKKLTKFHIVKNSFKTITEATTTGFGKLKNWFWNGIQTEPVLQNDFIKNVDFLSPSIDNVD